MPISKTTNYAGEFLQEIQRKLITGNETVQNGLVYIKDGIKGKFNIPRTKVDDIIQARIATPTGSTGTFTFDERQLIPDDFMVYTEFNPSEFEDYWKPYQPTGNLVFQELPSEVQTAMMGEVLDSVDNYMGSALWNGNKTLTGSTNLKYFNGFITKALADSDVIDVSNPFALTADNIVSGLSKVYKSTPTAVRQNPNYRIIMSLNSYDLYEEAQYAKTYKGKDETDAGLARYRGKQIVPLVGFPDDTIIATIAAPSRSSNLWVGVSALDDSTTIQVEKLQANSELYFFKMIMKVDTQIKWGEETVLFKA